MAKLYELNRQIEEFEFELDEETGEILNAEELERLELERDEKIENLALWVKNMKADRAALKNEKKSFDTRMKELDQKISAVESCISRELDGEKFTTSKVDIRWRKTTSVDVYDLKKLPQEFLRIKQAEPDKVAIKRRLSAGAEVAGAVLMHDRKMSIK